MKAFGGGRRGEDEALDNTWDGYRGDPGAPGVDPVIQELHEQYIPGPNAWFERKLRQQIVIEATRTDAPRDVRSTNHGSIPEMVGARHVVPVGRMRGLSRFGNAVSAVLAAALLLAMTGALIRDADRGNRPASVVPAAVQVGSPESGTADVAARFADVPMPGADPARTSNQPGPGLESVPEIAVTGTATGNSMVLADDALIVLNWPKLRSIDPDTLAENWSVDIDGGYFSQLAVGDGRIYFSVALDTESGKSGAGLGELRAYSQEDGSLLWSRSDIGLAPISPIPSGDTVFAAGATNGEYTIGAYRASDGGEIWSTRAGRYTWCCPKAGLAMADGVLVASLLGDLVAVNTETGSVLWSARPDGRSVFGTPVIGGGQVMVASSDEQYADVFIPAENGLVQAFDLKSGELVWENASPRSFEGPLSVADGILYAGIWGETAEASVAMLSATDGQVEWDIPFPRVEGDGQEYVATLYGVPAVVVGETAYLVTSTVRSAGGNLQASLLSAIDTGTGEITWMAQVTGGVTSAPIVVDGRVFLLTGDFGMAVLQGSGEPFVTPGQVVDLRSMPVCTAPVADSPMLKPLPDAPSIPAVADWKTDIRFSDIPVGQPLPETVATVQQLVDMFDHYRACSEADPYRKVFGFFSTDFYVRLQSVQEYWGEPEQPWAIWMAPLSEYLFLDPLSVDQLPDGRVGGIVNSSQLNFYVWFVEEDGVWKIDEFHRIVPDEPMGAPTAVATP